MTDPLADPGLSDLTADVDFAFLQAAVGERLISFGPVTQRHFLTQLHINVRLQVSFSFNDISCDINGYIIQYCI